MTTGNAASSSGAAAPNSKDVGKSPTDPAKELREMGELKLEGGGPGRGDGSSRSRRDDDRRDSRRDSQRDSRGSRDRDRRPSERGRDRDRDSRDERIERRSSRDAVERRSSRDRLDRRDSREERDRKSRGSAGSASGKKDDKKDDKGGASKADAKEDSKADSSKPDDKSKDTKPTSPKTKTLPFKKGDDKKDEKKDDTKAAASSDAKPADKPTSPKASSPKASSPKATSPKAAAKAATSPKKSADTEMKDTEAEKKAESPKVATLTAANLAIQAEENKKSGDKSPFSALSEISEQTDTDADETRMFQELGFSITPHQLGETSCKIKALEDWVAPVEGSPLTPDSECSDAPTETLSQPGRRGRRMRSRSPRPPAVVDLLEEGSDEEAKRDGAKIMHCGYIRWQGKEYVGADDQGKSKARLELKGEFVKMRVGEELLWSKKLNLIRSFRKIADEDLPNTYIYEIAHGKEGTAPHPFLFCPQHNIASWFDAVPVGNQVSLHYTWEDLKTGHSDCGTDAIREAITKFQAYTMEDQDEKKVSHLPNVFNNTPTKLTFMNVEITNYDARRFEKAELFNDSCIDFFMKMILYLLSDFAEDAPKCFAFSSLFYSKLKSDCDNRKDLAGVTKWSKGGDILNKDLLIVPINDNNVHWWLTVVVNPKSALLKDGQSDMQWQNEDEQGPRIVYMDSLSGVASVGGGGYRKNMNDPAAVKGHVGRNLKAYMAEECKSIEGNDFDRDAVDELMAKAPVQENFTDCGIFVLEYITQVLLRPSILNKLGKVKLTDWFAQSLVSHRREQLRACLAYLAEISNHGEESIDELMKQDDHKNAVKQFLISRPVKPDKVESAGDSEEAIVTVGLAEVAPSLRLFVKIDRDQQEFDFAPGICVVITELRKANGKSFMRNMKFEMHVREHKKLRLIIEERATTKNVVVVARQGPEEMSDEEASALALIGFDYSAQKLGPRTLIIGSKTTGLGNAVLKTPPAQMRMMVLRVKWSDEGISEFKQTKGKKGAKKKVADGAADGNESDPGTPGPEESPPNTETGLKRQQSDEPPTDNEQVTKRARTEEKQDDTESKPASKAGSDQEMASAASEEKQDDTE